MIKKSIYLIFIFFLFNPIIANASSNSLVKIGNNFYNSLIEAIENASSTDVI